MIPALPDSVWMALIALAAVLFVGLWIIDAGNQDDDDEDEIAARWKRRPR